MLLQGSETGGSCGNTSWKVWLRTDPDRLQFHDFSTAVALQFDKSIYDFNTLFSKGAVCAHVQYEWTWTQSAALVVCNVCSMTRIWYYVATQAQKVVGTLIKQFNRPNNWNITRTISKQRATTRQQIWYYWVAHHMGCPVV